MKVIFIKDLKKVAKNGEIKDLKDGYANFLIKNKVVVPLTDNNVNIINIKNKELKDIDEDNKKNYKEIKNNLEKEKIVFKVKTGKDDKVFGQISQKQIKEELIKKGYKIEKKDILIDCPIQSLGFHNITINLYKDIKAIIRVELIK